MDPDQAFKVNSDPDPAYKVNKSHMDPGFLMTNFKPPKKLFYAQFSSQIAI